MEIDILLEYIWFDHALGGLVTHCLGFEKDAVGTWYILRCVHSCIRSVRCRFRPTPPHFLPWRVLRRLYLVIIV